MQEEFHPLDCSLWLQYSNSNNPCHLFADVSVVVSAPTGSGKTVIFELAIIRLLTKLEAMEYAGQYKIVYSK
jgi:replicative superfamily II helicase